MIALHFLFHFFHFFTLLHVFLKTLFVSSKAIVFSYHYYFVEIAGQVSHNVNKVVVELNLR